MHPYRTAPMPARRTMRIDPEDAVLYGLMMGIGVIPVAIAVITRATFGFDATLGLLMLGVGILGLAIQMIRRR